MAGEKNNFNNEIRELLEALESMVNHEMNETSEEKYKIFDSIAQKIRRLGIDYISFLPNISNNMRGNLEEHLEKIKEMVNAARDNSEDRDTEAENDIHNSIDRFRTDMDSTPITEKNVEEVLSAIRNNINKLVGYKETKSDERGNNKVHNYYFEQLNKALKHETENLKQIIAQCTSRPVYEDIEDELNKITRFSSGLVEFEEMSTVNLLGMIDNRINEFEEMIKHKLKEQSRDNNSEAPSVKWETNPLGKAGEVAKDVKNGGDEYKEPNQAEAGQEEYPIIEKDGNRYIVTRNPVYENDKLVEPGEMISIEAWEQKEAGTTEVMLFVRTNECDVGLTSEQMQQYIKSLDKGKDNNKTLSYEEYKKKKISKISEMFK